MQGMPLLRSKVVFEMMRRVPYSTNKKMNAGVAPSILHLSGKSFMRRKVPKYDPLATGRSLWQYNSPSASFWDYARVRRCPLQALHFEALFLPPSRSSPHYTRFSP